VTVALAALALAAAPGVAACPDLGPTAEVSYVARVRRPLLAYRQPGTRPFARFGLRNVNGIRTFFAVVDAQAEPCGRSRWLKVLLPIRPNGATGWIRAGDVALGRVSARIVVDLSAREVELYRNGALAFRTRAAIGSSATPTPTGSYYVNQKIVPSSPGGPYGAGAMGISAFSPVLVNWPQGGPVAIHGTNQPSLIGRRISNGCIRVTNAAIRRLWREAPHGTPVVIRR
jgi:lipoprotein-anchoring transpeptidase ErfK/SrfK